MSDNITAPATGAVVATKEIGGVHFPKNLLADFAGADILGLLTANPDPLSLVGRLKTIADAVAQIAGYTDGLEGLATALNGFVDGLEAIEGAIGQPSAAAAAAIVPVATAAAANGLLAKNGAGNLYGFNGYSAVDGWWMVIDANAIPLDGAVAPIDFFRHAADSNFSADFSGAPLRCATGITILFSMTGPYAFTGSATASISAKVK